MLGTGVLIPQLLSAIAREPLAGGPRLPWRPWNRRCFGVRAVCGRCQCHGAERGADRVCAPDGVCARQGVPTHPFGDTLQSSL